MPDPLKMFETYVFDKHEVKDLGPRPETFEFLLLAPRCRFSFYGMKCFDSYNLGIPTFWSWYGVFFIALVGEIDR